jgi:predicted nucleotidyltransferase
MRPLSSDLREFIRLLNSEGVDYLIVGAWALAFHGRPRYTGDVDIFVRRSPANADRMMRVVEAFGFG